MSVAHDLFALQYLVVIGATFDDLEPINEFLQGLPVEIRNLSVIIAQPQRSLLHEPQIGPQIGPLIGQLRATSPWPVVRIQPAMRLEAGMVYVTPDQMEPRFFKGCFQLVPSSEASRLNSALDQLFRDLAHQTDWHPIAVILSGSGQDGAKGLAPVKRAGGWTFAEPPESAQLPGMPLAAIQTGHIDYLLPPAEIGAKIQKLIAEVDDRSGASMLAESGSEPLDQILRLLAQRCGTDFRAYKPSSLLRRIQHRQIMLNLPELTAYLAWIQTRPQELDMLFKTLLIGVTAFYRDPEVFSWLEDYLLELLRSKGSGESIRLWIPACSTGEEAYTYALLLHRLKHKHQIKTPVQIFATDLDERALAQARSGRYPETALKQVPPELLAAYFVRHDNDFEIDKSLRSMVVFSQHDLTMHPPFHKLDLISCRNLLIYLGADVQKQVFPSFHFGLHSDGLLILGKSESVQAGQGLFEPVQSDLKIFRRSKTRTPLHRDYLQSSSRLVTGLTTNLKPEHDDLAVQQMFSELYAHSHVLINDAYELQQVFGDVSAYLTLPQGPATHQLLSVCRPELRLELRSLLLQAQQEQRCVSSFPQSFGTDEHQWVKLRVHPGKPGQQRMLVVFESLEPMPYHVPLHANTPETDLSQASLRIDELRQELAMRESRLNALVGQLDLAQQQQQALNEELQSANEELQASNEELSTSNEELHTSNEEIQVAYSELRSAHRLLEQKEQGLLTSEANLRALLDNTSQAFLLVDTAYRILTYNQQAVALHQQLYQRPLTDNMLFIDSLPPTVLQALLPLLQQAPQAGSLREDIQIEGPEGRRWLRYELIPVIGPQQQAMGIAVSCFDITLQEQARQTLEQQNELIDAIFTATDVGLCLIDEQGVLHKVNQRFCQIQGREPEGLLGHHLSELVPPNLREQASAYHEDFVRTGSQPPREWRLSRPDGSYVDIMVTAQPLKHPDGSLFKVATVLDITADKKNRDLLLDTQQLTGIGGWEVELPGGQIHFTPEVYAIYGIPLNQAMDVQKALSFYLPESRARLERALQRASEFGEPYDLELAFRRGNGEQAWVRATCRPTQLDGKTIRLFGTFQNISELRQAQGELHKLSLVAQQIPSMVLITDASFRIDYANAACQTQTGYSLSELIGQDPLVLQQGEQTSADTLLQLRHAQKQQQAIQSEVLFYDRDSKPFWCEVSITPVVNNLGDPSCYIVLQTDISERKRREELLQFQSDILSHVSDAVVVCDLEGQLTYWNKGAERTYGYSEQEALQLSIAALAPVFDAPTFVANYQRGDNPTRSNPEVRCLHKDGNWIWVTLRLDVIYSADRVPLGVIGVSRDITEKRRYETALRQSEETFRTLIEKSTDGILVINTQGIASYVSASTERLLGYTTQELQAIKLFDLVHDQDQIAVKNHYEELASQTSTSSQIEFRVRHRSQSWIWVECNLRHLQHEPHLQGLICNFRDITQRKETEYRLHQHEQLYHSIAENFPRGLVMVLDHRYNCIFAEGQETDPSLRLQAGQSFLDCFPEAVRGQVKNSLSQAFSGQQQGFEIDLGEKGYALSLVPLKDQESGVHRMLVVLQNITEARQAAEEKNRLIQELIAKNDDLNQFTYIISHNLRAPVANLLGLVNLMDFEGHILPQGAETFALFGVTVSRLDETIQDLNRILNIRRHRDEVSKPIDLESELAWTLTHLETLYPALRGWVKTQLEVNRFFGVQAYIQSILYNLISNAVKYARPDQEPHIVIRSGRDDEYIWIEVEDNGLGLDLSLVREKLFRLYMRFHPHIEGKGLGLYLIKSQAEALGGGIRVCSEPGKGTRFHVFFKETGVSLTQAVR